MPLTIVAIFRSLPEAHAASAMLDRSGIDNDIGGSAVASVDPFSALQRGRVELIVDAQDAPAARERLLAAGYAEAVEQVERARRGPVNGMWARNFRVAGLLIALMGVLLWLTEDEPGAATITGLGLLLWAIGVLGKGRGRRPGDDARAGANDRP